MPIEPSTHPSDASISKKSSLPGISLLPKTSGKLPQPVTKLPSITGAKVGGIGAADVPKPKLSTPRAPSIVKAIDKKPEVPSISPTIPVAAKPIGDDKPSIHKPVRRMPSIVMPAAVKDIGKSSLPDIPSEDLPIDVDIADIKKQPSIAKPIDGLKSPKIHKPSESLNLPEPPKVPETPQSSEVPKVPETPQSSEVPETPQSSEEPKVPETPQSSEVPKVPETPQSSEVPKVPETPQSSEEPKVPETPQSSEVPKVPETPQSSEVPKVPETPQSSEVPETPQSSEVPKVPETPQSSEVPKVVSSQSLSAQSRSVSHKSISVSAPALSSPSISAQVNAASLMMSNPSILLSDPGIQAINKKNRIFVHSLLFVLVCVSIAVFVVGALKLRERQETDAEKRRIQASKVEVIIPEEIENETQMALDAGIAESADLDVDDDIFVYLSTKPGGADIYLDGMYIGATEEQTVFEKRLTRSDERSNVVLVLDGYLPKRSAFTRNGDFSDTFDLEPIPVERPQTAPAPVVKKASTDDITTNKAMVVGVPTQKPAKKRSSSGKKAAQPVVAAEPDIVLPD